ncbi:hypothetical protein [Achromobacter anxifer]|uniref:hypothetical protein n=1 Tax=Achromobacter anxifer TaxID=1287737 RepID=UPI00159083CF|nr:hypothetical protein [Achromobacter anxifer]
MAHLTYDQLRANSDCAGFLDALGILDHPGLRWDARREGYKDFTFGCRSGPGKESILDLAHELAHAVQFGPRKFKSRVRASGFVFKVPHVIVAGQWCADAKTSEATRRELETFALSAHLLEIAGLSFNRIELFDHGAHLMTSFMHDWYHIPGEGDDGRKQWCVGRTERYYARRDQKWVMTRLIGWLNLTEAHIKRRCC